MNTNEHKCCWRAGARWRAGVLVAAVFGGTLLAGAGAAFAGDHGVDFPMNDDPALPEIVRAADLSPALKGLWMRALERPEAGMRLEVLLALPEAQRLGMPEVEAFGPKALALLKDEKQEGAIRLAAAKALAALDVKEAGGELLAADQSGNLEMALVADAALARWKTAGAMEMWVGRVKDERAADQMMRSAVRSLGVLGKAEGAEAVRGVLMDLRRNSATRLVAAEAVAELGTDGVEVAGELLKGKSVEDRLLAAAALPATKNDKAAELLVGLAQDAEPGVAAAAVAKLMAAEPDALAGVAGKLAESPDAVIRREAAEVLRRHGDAGNAALLAKMLGDLAPAVRGAAREGLIALDGEAGLRDVVRSATREQLDKGNWQAMEQAALVLGSVQEVAAKDRLLALLRHERVEVRIGAIVALRRLALPETLDAQYQRAEELAGQLVKRGGAGAGAGQKWVPGQVEAMDGELGQLNQNLGRGKVLAADGYLRRFIPKGSGYGVQARKGAIWALGILHADSGTQGGLARELAERMQDMEPKAPEALEVKMMSAITLARTRDKSAKAALSRGVAESGGQGGLAEAAGWGLAYLEGKPYAGPAVMKTRTIDWFLQPAE